jgi:FkbM family methyltransferase
MGLRMFISTCQGILRNPGVSPIPAILRHAAWHGVRRFLALPATIDLTERSRLFIEKRQEMNGSVALVWSQRLYDYHNMSFLGHLGATGLVRTSFDIGANIGIYSLVMSECPDVTVHAFEPHPATFATLRRTITQNGRANVHAWQTALSDATGTIDFTNDDFSTVNQALAPGEQAENTIQVPCETASSFCQRLQLTPDLLKIDTEGHEPAVLRGFGALLDSVKFVLAEMNASPEIMGQMLPPSKFAGPLYVNMPARRLQRERHTHEDAIYINRSAIPALTQTGFTVEEDQ